VIERAEALRALIECRLPLEPAISALAALGWDAVEPAAFVSTADVQRLLQRFIVEELTAEQVTDWADLIECREDIGYAPMNEHLGEVVFRLANPNLNGPVTREVALEIRSQLRGSSHGIE
jgi:hypothetical protein